MKFGLFGGAKSKGGGELGDSIGYKAYIDYVLTAEALGYHSTFIVEHHFTGVGQVSASLNFLSYLAGRTSTMRLGTAVVVLPWHNPVLLAEQVATLDLVSGGRFDFGVGKGYREAEFAGFCIPLAESTERFEETVAFLKTAWTTEGRFSHHGKFWNFEDIIVEPRPTQRPHPPFWMGAGSFEGIKRAAQGGYNLLLDQLAPIDLIIERVKVYRAEWERLHEQPYQSEQVAVARALFIARNEAERKQAFAARAQTLKAIGALARGPGAEKYQDPSNLTEADIANEDSALIGTPDEIIAKLKRLRTGGIETVLLVDPSGSLDSLKLFAAEIMPEFRAPARPARVQVGVR